MSEHPLQGLMDVALQRIKEMVDSNTIIGEPITMADGTLILPVSKVSFGFASGGSDFPSKTPRELFGGGSGAGVSISPIAFLVVKDGSVKMLQLASQEANTTDRIINALPDVLDKLQDMFKKDRPGADGQG
ncbi:GerW family sporulation protein [Anaerofilum sp. BX8]|uniref:GerW family sporulation protein n=1 Tax=Anaerofilum hominis TaxID=2763016 RepID=A0A923I8D6_9FIRM|nr:GerW family sporulation protein [Anaerofilum hominis]MBC5582168.1 GerW family sporulation protein [Anaerofilum hominis]